MGSGEHARQGFSTASVLIIFRHNFNCDLFQFFPLFIYFFFFGKKNFSGRHSNLFDSDFSRHIFTVYIFIHMSPDSGPGFKLQAGFPTQDQDYGREAG